MEPVTLESLKAFANIFKRVPVWDTLTSDPRLPLRTPTETFKILKNLSRQCFILDSAEDHKKDGRYTFLGYDPKLEITCAGGSLKIRNGAEIILETKKPGEYIKKILEDNTSPKLAKLPPFYGGLVGYFAYDYIKYAEPALNLDAKDEEGFKDADLMLFDKVIAYDNLENLIYLIVNIKTDALEENYNRALAELSAMKRLVTGGKPAEFKKLELKSEFSPLFDEASYCSMVEKAKLRIREGDIFQVVLSNRLAAEATGSLFDTYQILREKNPSPYMFYFASDDIEIAGAAPETLVKLTGEKIFTYPLAGTRPRGKDASEDALLEKELLNDEKELAEHHMLVDLGRNDIGKLSEIGSVEVDKYLSVLRFSHVMHIGSVVTGKIAKGKGPLDAIDAVLPAGTLSGAPKFRACEIINELENNKRGIYGGAIGYISFTGDMDTCIAIRMAFKKNGKVFVRSGAGIVADSVPQKEYAECEGKMRAVVEALKEAAEKNR